MSATSRTLEHALNRHVRRWTPHPLGRRPPPLDSILSPMCAETRCPLCQLRVNCSTGIALVAGSRRSCDRRLSELRVHLTTLWAPREGRVGERTLHHERARSRLDLLLGEEHEPGGVAQRDERVLARDPRERDRRSPPRRAPSRSPPRRRPSSASRRRTSTLPVAPASRRMSPIGSGASHRRSTHPRADARRGQPAEDAEGHRHAVAERHDRQVTSSP